MQKILLPHAPKALHAKSTECFLHRYSHLGMSGRYLFIFYYWRLTAPSTAQGHLRAFDVFFCDTSVNSAIKCSWRGVMRQKHSLPKKPIPDWISPALRRKYHCFSHLQYNTPPSCRMIRMRKPLRIIFWDGSGFCMTGVIFAWYWESSLHYAKKTGVLSA